MKLLHGGLPKYSIINGIKIVAAPRQQPPFVVEVMVFEEDTNLILTVDKEIYYQEEHPIRLMTSLINAKNHQVGSLVKNQNSWYAVVVDINADTICTSSWVLKAYKNLFSDLVARKIPAAGIHLLGQHGKLPLQLAVQLLLDTIRAVPQCYLRRIWLIVPEQDIKTVRGYLSSL